MSNLNILIKAILDKEGFEKDIDKQLKGLQSILEGKNLSIKIDLDAGQIKATEKASKGVSDSFKDAQTNIDKYRKEIEGLKKDLQEVGKVNRENNEEQKKAFEEYKKNSVLGRMKEYGVKRPLQGEKYYDEFMDSTEGNSTLRKAGKKSYFKAGNDSSASDIDSFLTDNKDISESELFSAIRKGVPKIEDWYETLRQEEELYKGSIQGRIKELQNAIRLAEQNREKLDDNISRYKMIQKAVSYDSEGAELSSVRRYEDEEGNGLVSKHDAEGNVEVQTEIDNFKKIEQARDKFGYNTEKWKERMATIVEKSYLSGVDVNEDLNDLFLGMEKLDAFSKKTDFDRFNDSLKKIEKQLEADIKTLNEFKKVKDKALKDAEDLNKQGYLSDDELKQVKIHTERQKTAEEINKNIQKQIDGRKEAIQQDKEATKLFNEEYKINKQIDKVEQDRINNLKSIAKERKLIKEQVDGILNSESNISGRNENVLKQLLGDVNTSKTKEELKDISDEINGVISLIKKEKEERQKSAKDQLEYMTADGYASQRKRLNKQVAELKVEGKATTGELDKLQDKIKQVNSATSLVEAEKAIKNLKKQYETTGQAVVDSYASDKKRLNKQVAELKVDGKATSQELDKLRNSIEGIDSLESLVKTEQGIKKLKEAYKDTKTAVDEYASSRKRLNKQVAELEYNGKGTKDEIDGLKDSIKNIGDLNSLVKAEQEIKNLKEAYKDSGDAVDRYSSQKENLNKKLIRLQYNGKGTNEEIGKLKQAINSISSTESLVGVEEDVKQLERKYSDTTKTAKDLGTEIGDLTQKNKDLNNVTKKQFLEMVKLNDQYEEQDVRAFRIDRTTGKWAITLQENAKEQRTLGGHIEQTTGKIYKQSDAMNDVSAQNLGVIEQFKIALARVPIWMGAMTAFYGTLRGTQAMVDVISRVDQEMTELKRVMDEDTNFNQMLQESIDLSKELGNNLEDVQKTVAGFARQGFDAQESIEMARTATVASNVSELTADESMEKLTALMTQFRVEAENSIEIVDKLNEVDNSFAITTKNLADATSKAGATAQTFGVTLDEMIGNVTAIGVATRETGSVIGNSLKTIYSRITTMDSSVGALEAVGISIKDASGGMRSVSDILDELHGKWNTLSEEQRQHTSVALAGREQLSRFLALMNNYEMGLNATETALNSNGSAMRENAEYMKSIQAQVNQLKVSWEEMALAVGDAFLTDAYTNVVSSLTAMAEGGTWVASTLGVLPPLFVAVGNASLLMATKFLKASTITGALSVAVRGLGSALLFLKANFLPLAIATAVFAGLGIAIEAVTKKWADAREESIELRAEQENLLKSYSASTGEINSLASEYERLTDLVKRGKIEEDSKEYLDVQNKLNELMPSLTDEIDEQGNARLKSVELVKEELEYAQKLKDINNLEQAENFEKDLDARAEKVRKLSEAMEDAQKGIKRIDFAEKYQSGDSAQLDYSDKRYELQRKLMGSERELQLLMSNSTKYAEDKAKAFLDVSKATEYLSDADYDLISSFVEKNKATLESSSNAEEYRDNLEELINKTTTYGEDLSNFNSLVRNGSEDAWSHMIPVMEEYGWTMADIRKHVEELKAEKEGENEQVQDTAERVKELNEYYDDTINRLKTLNGYIEEYEENNSLSADSLAEIADEYPHLLQYMDDEETLIQKLKDERKREAEQARKTLQEKLMYSEEYYTSVLKANKTYFDELGKTYNVDFENYKTLEQAKAKVTSELLGKLQKAWKDYFGLTAEQMSGFFDDNMELTSEGSEYLRWMPEEEKRKAIDEWGQLKKQIDEFRNITIDPIQIDFEGIGTSSSKDKKKKDKKGDEPDYQDATDALIRQINLKHTLIQQDSEIIKDSLTMAENQEDYNKQLEITNSLMEKNKDRMEEIEKANKKLHEKAESTRKSSGFDTTGWFDVNEELTTEYFDKYNKSSKTTQEQMQKVADRLKKLKDAYEENKEEVKSLTGENFNLNESLAEIKKQIEDLRWEELNRMVGEFNDKIDDQNFVLELSQIKLGNLNKESSTYREELMNQIGVYEELHNITGQTIAELERQIKYEGLTGDRLKQKKEDLEDAKLEYYKYKDAIFDINRELESQANELIDSMVDKVKEGYEEAKDAKIDAIEEEIEAENERHEQVMDNLDDELDQYEKVINAKIDAMNDESDERGYNKELTKLLEERQELQNKINALSMDDSIEAKARLSELEEQKAGVDESIEELKYNRQKELRENNLKDELDAKKEEIDAQKEAENAQHEETVKRLDKDKEAWQDHYDDLINEEVKYTKMREKILEESADKVALGFEAFRDFMINEVFGEMGEGIDEELIRRLYDTLAMIQNVRSEMNSLGGMSDIGYNGGGSSGGSSGSGSGGSSGSSGGSSGSGTQSVIQQMKRNSNDWHNATDEERRKLEEENQRLGSSIGANYDPSSGEWFRNGVPLYHEGGLVGGQSKNKVSEIINKMFNTKPNEAIVKSLIGELQVPPQNIEKNFMPNMKKMLDLASSSSKMVALQPQGTTVNMNVVIERVEGGKTGVDTFMKEMNNRLKGRGVKI